VNKDVYIYSAKVLEESGRVMMVIDLFYYHPFKRLDITITHWTY